MVKLYPIISTYDIFGLYVTKTIKIVKFELKSEIYHDTSEK